jgi:hypothetical protein
MMTDTTSTITTTGTSTVAGAAATAEKVVEAIAKVQGPLLTGISIFVPGASAFTVPMETLLPLILPDIEKALNDISAGTYTDIFSVAKEFVQHITMGFPNSPILSQVNAVINSPPAPTGPVTAD